jgi:DNA-binding Lrp family transcriptional regulator
MDKTDRKILSELQKNGRLSSQALAERVGLSTTPCWRRVHPDSVAEFDRLVADCPEILECYAMSGQHDYLLKVICESISAYDALLGKTILQCKAVHTVNTSFVLRTGKNTTALPLGSL